MNKKVVVITGATATGKSKMAIHLAKALNTDIISADSMQVYKKLNIASAKVPNEKQSGVKHHLLSIVNSDVNFLVKDFASLASNIIEDLSRKEKPSIIAGGTLYYLESLLFDSYLSSSFSMFSTDLCSIKEFEKNVEENYALLQKVDPLMAQKLHPNDKRKIANSLSVFLRTGVPHSELILKKGSNKKVNSLYDFFIVVLGCERKVLDSRIDLRIDRMIQKGLLEEIYDIRKEIADSKLESPNVTQAIGYSEFEALFSELEKDGLERHRIINYFELVKDAAKKGDIELENTKATTLDFENFDKYTLLLKSAIEEMKRKSKKYAQYQKKWIEKRFLKNERLSSCLIDTTDENFFEKTQYALEQIEKFLNSDFDELKRSKSNIEDRETIKNTLLTWKKYECEVCKKIYNGSDEWSKHLKTKNHKRLLTKKAAE